ncbi:hypothetical protein WJ24_27695 [Burkholderia vietnamiensis]|uniref:hypothetical protein n=1 Tax=Burkholderia vietnamiensis TaxID=60552 RepID=UPI00075986CD|nr:hypothetical protein [Burkholderia vietnamiensis]KVG05413.1 hypothetical protein WJ24_27695 [Burkholderia vietnamiensis]
MKDSDNMIDLLPVETEVVTAKEFLRLTKENPTIVKHSRVTMAPLGSKDFGNFEVTYTRPIYKHIIVESSCKKK